MHQSESIQYPWQQGGTCELGLVHKSWLKSICFQISLGILQRIEWTAIPIMHQPTLQTALGWKTNRILSSSSPLKGCCGLTLHQDIWVCSHQMLLQSDRFFFWVRGVYFFIFWPWKQQGSTGSAAAKQENIFLSLV